MLAQNKNESLKLFADKANSGSKMAFEFIAIDAKGELALNTKGSVTIFNNMYRMEIPGEILAIDNGVKRWFYNISAQEIVVTNVDPQNQNIAENPFLILREKNLNDIKGYKVKLVARENLTKKSPLLNIPQYITLTSETGAEYKIIIIDFKEVEGITLSNFVLNPDIFPDVIVTEL